MHKTTYRDGVISLDAQQVLLHLLADEKANLTTTECLQRWNSGKMCPDDGVGYSLLNTPPILAVSVQNWHYDGKVSHNERGRTSCVWLTITPFPLQDEEGTPIVRQMKAIQPEDCINLGPFTTEKKDAVYDLHW